MSKEKPYLRLSVHELVDFLLRKGDIDNRVYNQDTMNLGSLMHSSYQKKQGKEYLSEYPLSATIALEEGTIALSGRADGIIVGGDYPIIDEIKSTVLPLEVFFEQQKEWHLGQALCYAYMYLTETGGDQIGVRLSYLSQLDSSAALRKDFVFTWEEVEERIHELARSYFAFEERRMKHVRARDLSIRKLPFPYREFREGQRQLSQCVYGLCKRGGVFFAEAPTGIGKTISTLYPAVLSFDHKNLDKIFYLTAKNTGGISAYDTLTDLYKVGLKARDSFLVAKDKICFCPGHACNPDDCPYAKDYYTKLKDALNEAEDRLERFDMLGVKQIALQYSICPFEFQLDLSLQADIVICDYNYFFDPRVKLQRYFDETVDASKDFILVDEAHNLIDRGRDMYSACISKNHVLEAKRSLKGKEFRSLQRSLKKLADALAEELGGEESQEIENGAFVSYADSIRKKQLEYGKEYGISLPEECVSLSRELGKYKLLCEQYDSPSIKHYLEQGRNGVELHFRCLDPSSYLRESMQKVRGCALFSATLSPISYYMSALNGTTDSPYLLLPSPFPKENLHVLIAPKISLRYKDRDASLKPVSLYLKEFVQAKKGNYFIYFPSYAYLESILPYLDFEDAEVQIQSKSMSHDERTIFLEAFQPNPNHTTVGLLTLGGVFGEGVDLVDDRLIGVAIVGVGLPQVGLDNDSIREYYDNKGSNGFDYAYRFPGMNKVTQAVGRLIRTPTDRGSALLIDDRYTQGEYRDVFGRLWPDAQIVLSPQEVRSSLLSFYKEKQK